MVAVCNTECVHRIGAGWRWLRGSMQRCAVVWRWSCESMQRRAAVQVPPGDAVAWASTIAHRGSRRPLRRVRGVELEASA